MTHAHPPSDPRDRNVNSHAESAGDPKLAELLRIESQWLTALHEDRAFADRDAFTQRVVAQWQDAPHPVVGRIGRARSAAIVLAWAAMLALLVGVSQTYWWHGVAIPEASPQNVHPVSTLVQHAGQRYDEQAKRVSRVLDEPAELISFERVVEMLVEPVARRATPDAATNE